MQRRKGIKLPKNERQEERKRKEEGGFFDFLS
jgi:hypothetical protein